MPTPPEIDWYQQGPDWPDFFPIHQASVGLFSLLREPIEFITDLDWSIQNVEQVPGAPLGASDWGGWSAFVDLSAAFTFVSTGWMFLGRFNPDDYPLGTLFFFEAIIDTSNASLVAQARLFNVTDGVAVAGSVVSTTALHLTGSPTRVRSPAIILPSGNKRYRAERSGPAGSGVTIHLHVGKIIVDIV